MRSSRPEHRLPGTSRHGLVVTSKNSSSSLGISSTSLPFECDVYSSTSIILRAHQHAAPDTDSGASDPSPHQKVRPQNWACSKRLLCAAGSSRCKSPTRPTLLPIGAAEWQVTPQVEGQPTGNLLDKALLGPLLRPNFSAPDRPTGDAGG